MLISSRKVKKLLSIFFVSILVLSFAPKASALSLGLSNSKQVKTLWCWAASAQIIGRYYGYTGTQADICVAVMGDSTNQSANIYEAATAIQHASGQTNTAIRYRALSQSEVHQEIYADQEPFEIRVGWNGSLTNGHFIVCGGYTGISLETFNPLDNNNVSNDYSYTDLVNGIDITGGHGVWTHSTIFY